VAAAASSTPVTLAFLVRLTPQRRCFRRTGLDAATGATAVHRLGGTVIAASLGSPYNTAMPQATITRTTVTEHVTALDDVPACSSPSAQRR
jgi:ABC-type nitrate/sulfonate/bicarbonate transport system permease component